MCGQIALSECLSYTDLVKSFSNILGGTNFLI